ncbi:MAG: MMPL family transporter [Methanomassiliicoccaceae archaeon]|nr:MMPL family transporter [Methanomassiliicoccaceae archaeon]
MKFMGKAGEIMSNKPVIPLAVLMMITIASIGIIAMNPPSFDMDEGSFTPDNELVRASAIIDMEFTSSVSVMSLVDTGSADLFTKEMFIDVLTYERSLYYMNIGDSVQTYSGLMGPAFRVFSPVSFIASVIATGDPFSIDYDFMISEIEAMTDPAIKISASALLNPAPTDFYAPYAPMLHALIKNDLDPIAMTASGCMISVMIPNTALNDVGGRLGFERDVIAVTGEFMETTVISEGLSIKAVGMITMMSEIGELAQRDIGMLLPIALVVIVGLLLIIYRDVYDTLIGLLGLIIAVVWTFGIATAVGIQMSTIAIAVPILILALGIDYSLHLVFRYREERSSGKSPREAMENTMGSVGQALVLATVTTAIAFMSYQTSSMAALADFGLMCAIGIVCAFGVMLLLVPTVQVRRDRKAEKKGKDPNEARRYRKAESENGDVLGKISGIGGRMAAKNPWAVLGAVGIVVLIFGVGATNISYSFNMYDFIPEDTEAHDTLTYLNDNYVISQGSVNVLIYADGWDFDTIRAIELSLLRMESDPIRGVNYESDMADIEYLGTALRDINNSSGGALGTAYSDLFDVNGRLLDPADPAGPMLWGVLLGTIESIGMMVPGFEALVSSYTSSFIGSSDVTRIIIHMTPEIDGDNNAIIAMKDDIDAAMAFGMADAEISFVTTGQTIIMAITMEEMNRSQMTSLFVTIAAVILILTLFMYYVDRSWMLGLLSTIPTLISVVMVWGTMSFIGIPLNVMTLTIASLAVGLGVTYGIHISHRYVTELVKNDRDAGEAAKVATRETGKGVFAAAITTVAGFGIMIFSKILPMYQFGAITALAIGFGYIGSIFVLPSLLVIWGRYAKPKVMERAAKLMEQE